MSRVLPWAEGLQFCPHQAAYFLQAYLNPVCKGPNRQKPVLAFNIHEALWRTPAARAHLASHWGWAAIGAARAG